MTNEAVSGEMLPTLLLAKNPAATAHPAKASPGRNDRARMMTWLFTDTVGHHNLTVHTLLVLTPW